jgi:hypothetical protein
VRTVILAALLMLSAAPAFAASGGVYRCAAQDYRRLADDGTLEGAARAFWRQRYASVVVDTETAIIRAGGEPLRWQRVQEGSGASDFVAVRRDADLASAATDFIRIRDWDRKPRPTFLLFELSAIVTGTCEIVR